jgi:hypothetical protein
MPQEESMPEGMLPDGVIYVYRLDMNIMTGRQNGESHEMVWEFCDLKN